MIQKFGGSLGVRDINLLESAVYRPFNTFDSVDLYKDSESKAAAIIESIVKNHPFIDGNKRVGYTLMRLFLLNEGLDIVASEEDKYAFLILIAESKLSYHEIKTWIENRIKR